MLILILYLSLSGTVIDLKFCRYMKRLGFLNSESEGFIEVTSRLTVKERFNYIGLDEKKSAVIFHLVHTA